jgi:hypothetical protein
MILNDKWKNKFISAIKWLSTNSTSYFNFILNIAKSGFNIEINDFNENEK